MSLRSTIRRVTVTAAGLVLAARVLGAGTERLPRRAAADQKTHGELLTATLEDPSTPGAGERELESDPARLELQRERVRTVVQTKGLVAFWDFDYAREGVWLSRGDPDAAHPAFPVHLRRIGDPKSYVPSEWPYDDGDSRLEVDPSGPFGKAVRFNQGFIYGAVEREHFDGTRLDLHGRRPFTIISWVKFVGRRHMVAGIWDEGGWSKYAGRRQVALFAGLFGQRGVIAHVSATGAASYPQSTSSGSQYARCRAIDGQPFENHRWIAMAATFDPGRGEVTAYLNGTMTPLALTDPVARDVYRREKAQAANPFRFRYPIYSPRAFVLKYNGYALDEVAEHRLYVDLPRHVLVYQRDERAGAAGASFRVLFDVERDGKSILEAPVVMDGVQDRTAEIPAAAVPRPGDEIRTRLERRSGRSWEQVGSTVSRALRDGAPFTFGRALGLGSESLEHGSQLYLDGVAVFDRVLAASELEELSFVR